MALNFELIPNFDFLLIPVAVILSQRYDHVSLLRKFLKVDVKGKFHEEEV
jgi:hypothetical protein